MTWSSTPPTEPGWYWTQYAEEHRPNNKAYTPRWSTTPVDRPVVWGPRIPHGSDLEDSTHDAAIGRALREAYEFDGMTAEPFYVIIDPGQIMKPDCYSTSGQVSGLFFSRKAAQDYLKARRHHFSDRAVTFAMSGHHSRAWKRICALLREVES